MDKVICTHCKTENSSKAKYCIECGFELPKIIKEVVPEVQTTVKPKKKRKYVSLLVIISLIVITLSVLGYFTYQKLVENKVFATIENVINTAKNPLQLIANEMNKSCPMMVDAETRLDKITLPSKTVFQYNYTLINYEKTEIDTVKIKSNLEQNIIRLTKTNPQMQYQRENNVTMNYIYNDKNGDYLMSIIITPELYK